MRIEDMWVEKKPAPEFTSEQIRDMWPQAAGELRGFAQALERGPAKITAMQLRMAIELAEQAYAAHLLHPENPNELGGH